MSEANFMTGKVRTRKRFFMVEKNADNTYSAVFKSKKWIFFTKKVKRQFNPTETIETLTKQGTTQYMSFFDNKTGEQLELREVFKGEIDHDRLNLIRDAQNVIAAEKNIDKSYEQDKAVSPFMISIAILIIIFILFVIGVYYQVYSVQQLASAIAGVHIPNPAPVQGG